MRRALGALILALFLTGCSLGGDDREKSAVASSQFLTDLIRLGSEEERGKVGLTAVDGKTRVVVEVSAPSSGQVAEIHGGNCDVLGGGVIYQLAPLKSGVSTTVVDIGLGPLRRMGYLVLVRGAELGPGGLCGDLAKAQPPSAAPSFE